MKIDFKPYGPDDEARFKLFQETLDSILGEDPSAQAVYEATLLGLAAVADKARTKALWSMGTEVLEQIDGLVFKSEYLDLKHFLEDKYGIEL